MGSMLNILHFHINDTSDEATIDQRWVNEQEADLIRQDRIEEVKVTEFKKDVMGLQLRYLILIHDSKV